MIKLLVLQSMYGLSDPELERQANDKISFLRFLGFPEKVPDQTTVWYFRERLSKTGKDKAIWNELQKQLEGKGLKIRKGVIQDIHLPILLGETRQKPGETKKVPGQKRAKSPILDSNFIRKKTAISD